MEIFPGIETHIIDSNILDMIKDIEEISLLPEPVISWKKSIEQLDTPLHFGVVNFDKLEKYNENSGIDLLLKSISDNCNEVFKNYAIDYSKRNYLPMPEYESFIFFKYLESNQERMFFEDILNGKIKRVALKYFINDDYDGGDIYFPRFDITIKPEKNKLLVFPSNYIYSIIEKPVIKGVKYQVSTWF